MPRTAIFALTLAVASAACGGAPAPRPSPAAQYRLAYEPSDHEDTPCTEREPASLLNALQTRVQHRIALPPGYVFVTPDGPQTGQILQADVLVAIHPTGRIVDSRVLKSSNAPPVDQALLTALRQAACMPVPPKELLDPASGTARIQVSYRFRRGG